jgi:hypothetical protein
VPLFSLDSSSQPPPGHVTLPVVPLSAADDQALFELNVRLQYSDDDRLLLPALQELTGAVGQDMPGEVLLQRPSILVSVALLGLGADDACGCRRWVCGAGCLLIAAVSGHEA